MSAWNDHLEMYDAAVAELEDVMRKGKTMPYTSTNGHMFSFLDKEGNLHVRLSVQDRAAFIKKHNTKITIQHGREMKAFAQVPDKIFSNKRSLIALLKKSLKHTSSLKPK